MFKLKKLNLEVRIFIYLAEQLMLLATVTANTSVAVSASTTRGKSYKHNFQDTLAACRCLFDFDPQGRIAYKCKVQGDSEQKGD